MMIAGGVSLAARCFRFDSSELGTVTLAVLVLTVRYVHVAVASLTRPSPLIIQVLFYTLMIAIATLPIRVMSFWIFLYPTLAICPSSSIGAK